jgi:hypothetical protein
MQRFGQIGTPIAAVVLAFAIGACSSDLGLNNVTLVPKPDTLLRKPDWATFSGGKNEFGLRPVTAADLVDSQGQCVSGPEQQAAAAEGTNLPAPALGGVALQMTECEVVRRAGPVEKVDFEDGSERVVVLTYLRGPAPGIYRFRGGRLTSIERAPTPPSPPAKPQKATPKKPTGT